MTTAQVGYTRRTYIVYSMYTRLDSSRFWDSHTMKMMMSIYWMQKIIIVVDIYRPWALDSLSFMTFTTTYAKSSLVLHYSNVDWARNHINQKSTTTYIYFFFGYFWFLSKVRNRLLWFAPILKLNIVPFLTPNMNFFFCFNGFSRI